MSQQTDEQKVGQEWGASTGTLGPADLGSEVLQIYKPRWKTVTAHLSQSTGRLLYPLLQPQFLTPGPTHSQKANGTGGGLSLLPTFLVTNQIEVRISKSAELKETKFPTQNPMSPNKEIAFHLLLDTSSFVE